MIHLILINLILDILTNVIEIIGGDINKAVMVGDSEVDSQSALTLKFHFILVKMDIRKEIDQIPHDILVKIF